MLLQSSRRNSTFSDAFQPKLNTIPQIDESNGLQSGCMIARVHDLQNNLRLLQQDYERISNSSSQLLSLLENARQQKDVLITQILEYRLTLERKDNYFRKILQYVNMELQHDRQRYESIIESLENQLKTYRTKSSTMLKLMSSTTNSDMDDYILANNNITSGSPTNQEHPNNSYLWDLQELFLKYMPEDNRLKNILFPVLRKMTELPCQEEILELCNRMFDQISQYEKQLQRGQFIGSLVSQFHSCTNLILSEDEQQITS